MLREGLTLTALPRDRRGWANLCRMLSAGRLRAKKGSCDLGLPDLWKFAGGLDLLGVILAWGACDGCPEDLNNDGVVDVLDLLTVILGWGGCP